MNETEIGAAIKARRVALALSQADVAALSATDRDTISTLENGAGTRLATVVKVAGVLGLDVTVGSAE